MSETRKPVRAENKATCFRIGIEHSVLTKRFTSSKVKNSFCVSSFLMALSLLLMSTCKILSLKAYINTDLNFTK